MTLRTPEEIAEAERRYDAVALSQRTYVQIEAPSFYDTIGHRTSFIVYRR